MTKGQRFIDYAHHGGCSAKLDATRLKRLLGEVGDGEFADAGLAAAGGMTFASSVDLVLPMIDDPELFGRIVVAHVLSDLYAVGAEPVFALNILSVPKPQKGEREPRQAAAEIDADVQAMLAAAGQSMREAGVACVGGHTLIVAEMIFGLAATGVMPPDGGVSNSAARPGDQLVLTKPLGTSIATKWWKEKKGSRDNFPDVVEGMLVSNGAASAEMLKLSRAACTDVTGFGFLGHLHNLVAASSVAATIDLGELPLYESVREAIPLVEPDHNTRIFDSNLAYVSAATGGLDGLNRKTQLLIADAQISGGLLVSCPAEELDGFLAGLSSAGARGWVIGEVSSGEPGRIDLR